MKALTVHQPWAWAVAEGFKPTENRSWRTHYRGRLLIHAGLAVDKNARIVRHSRAAAIRLDELGGTANLWNARQHIPSRLHTPHPTLAMAAAIAIATLEDCHAAEPGCCTPWGEPGVYHWQLTHVTVLSSPVPCTGRQGLWTPGPDIVRAADLAMSA